ncbi:hypothetical protein DRN72_00395 [Methanosarcinales archaeon]|nr:MAG: hypothetical protein DRN72_00395 [Methanosarcinales archaeon]
MRFVALVLLMLSLTLVLGCLEAKEAWPAVIPDNVLESEGWTEVGNVSYETFEEEIAGLNVSVNVAVQQYSSKKSISESIPSMPVESSTAQLITARVLVPGGVSLPEPVMEKIIDKMIQAYVEQLDITGLRHVEDGDFKTDSGFDARYSVYRGVLDKEVRLNVEILAAHWNDDESTIIVVALYPYGDVVHSGRTIGSIPSLRDEVLELIKKVE